MFSSTNGIFKVWPSFGAIALALAFSLVVQTLQFGPKGLALELCPAKRTASQFVQLASKRLEVASDHGVVPRRVAQTYQPNPSAGHLQCKHGDVLEGGLQ